jgi:hypothetical protein
MLSRRAFQSVFEKRERFPFFHESPRAYNGIFWHKKVHTRSAMGLILSLNIAFSAGSTSQTTQ